MADRTGIEWTDATWNPIVGCSLASPGCTNCYAMPMAARIEAMQPGSHYAGTTQPGNAGAVWSGKVALAPEHILTQPLRWRRPRRIFVNSMGDLFHESIPDEWIDHVFAIMALCPQHTFQVLTKRSARMREYLTGPAAFQRVDELLFAEEWPVLPKPFDTIAAAANMTPFAREGFLRNVWLGVSTEDQRRADERVPDLLATPAAIRFVSAEPLLGALNLRSLNERRGDRGTITDWHDALAGLQFGRSQSETAKLDLVIAGGENGPRPMHPDWARSLRDQCAAADVLFFFKQWGTWEVAVDRERDDPDWRLDYSRKFADGGATKWLNLAGGCGFHGARFHVMRRVAKARAGRLLDGVEHNALPEVRS
ncbi:phage Gp37/Gp68 family protein [Ancylobacter sp. WKF20]|uniref:DUF5131 family protein n=1 Tax=Ancylobacter sp. WKF20 TaxID=3039801 RepID=UPI0024342C74|nr:phage Gp37/Gp68 family protein [Ancylobacter sp. WKF20]WGD31249.1 phage Gp37/Gp68 family protein [Ancylobacter sp. WKF20]